jgi:hypothetical protein
MPTQDWNTIYSTDHEKWEELWRSQNPTDAEAYYRFEEAEIQALFKVCYVLFFHSLLTGNPVTARDIREFIREKKHELDGVNTVTLRKIVKECFDDKKVIQVQHAFSMLTIYVKHIIGSENTEKNIFYAKEILSAFGRCKGFTFESLKNPGLLRDLNYQEQVENDSEYSGSESGSDSESGSEYSDSESESGSGSEYSDSESGSEYSDSGSDYSDSESESESESSEDEAPRRRGRGAGRRRR